MPRIKDRYTDVAVYIYASLEDAEDGNAYGGSGFIADVPFETDPALHYLYIVTNKHVIEKSDPPVIRINRQDGKAECIPTRQDQWKFHSDGDDVAVFHLDTKWEKLRVATIRTNQFVSPQLITAEDIGIGDDTVMVGRFINHEGRQQNTPAVRFGNIAMMPKEKIVSAGGYAQESFLVEVRSLPGYSGSAVLIYSPCAMNDMSERRFGRPKEVNLFSGNVDDRDVTGSIAAKGPYLLGIDWCHLQKTVPVTDSDGKQLQYGWVVAENTGMAGVIPAWKIADVLHCEELKVDRNKEAERIAKQKRSSGVALMLPRRRNGSPKKTLRRPLKKASRKTKPKPTQ